MDEQISVASGPSDAPAIVIAVRGYQLVDSALDNRNRWRVWFISQDINGPAEVIG